MTTLVDTNGLGTLTGDVGGVVGDDRLTGLEGDDTLSGLGGRDILIGDDADLVTLDGSDTLWGGDGDDYLAGGRGNDVLNGEAGADVIYGGVAVPVPGPNITTDGGDDVIDGGAGTDSAILIYAQRVGDIVVDNSNAASTNLITVGGAAAGSIASIEVLTFYSGAGNDILTGGANFDFLLGGGGNDVINGGGANDTLNGGLGDDTINGGAGQDTAAYDVPGSTAGVTVDLRIQGAAQNTVGQGLDTLISIENLGGGYGSDVLIGDNGFNNFFDDFGGADKIFGGGGGDNASITRNSSTSAAVAIEIRGEAGADVLTFSGTKVAPKETVLIDGGSEDDNLIAIGFAAATLDGGAGNDKFFVDNIGSSTLTLGAGSDVVNIRAPGAAVSAGVITVTDFTPGADQITLSGAGNLLNGGLLNYVAGDNPFAGGYLRLTTRGADTVLQVDRDATLSAYQFTDLLILKNLTPQQAFGALPDGTGGVVDGFAVVPPTGPAVQLGGAAPDSLAGGAGNDFLQGLDGNDILVGGGSSDLLDGGVGIDTAAYSGLSRAYVFSGAAGTVSGGPEGGTDTLSGIERVKFVDGYFSTGAADTAAGVHRIYVAALGRAPDQSGLNNWVRAIDQGGASLQTVANGFIGSPEFLNRYGANTTNTEFLTLLYQNVLHRAPDAEGQQAWLDALNKGHTRAEVVIGFSDSPENKVNTATTVQQGIWVGDHNAAIAARFYDTVFGRLPDASGVASWTAALNAGASLNQVADGFVASNEFQTTYGALANDAFVQLMYQNVLHRAADPSGLASWVGALNAGHSRAEVVVGFSESPEHVALTAPHIDSGVWFA